MVRISVFGVALALMVAGAIGIVASQDASATAKSRPIAAVRTFSAAACSGTLPACWARVRAFVTSSNVARSCDA